jgi:CubicO group peptidase (beta-lactamase class C family)
MRLLLALLFPLTGIAQNYAPPYFADSATRLSRAQAAAGTITKIYADYARANHFPGMVFGVMVDGKFAVTGQAGVADIAANTPATPASAFRIASMSKSFTTLAILQLRDAGKLGLDEAAGNYIPELRKVRYLTTDAAPITIRQLMTHSAGFPEDNPWGDRRLADTDQELRQLLREGVMFSNVPGVHYEYSNLAFALLGKIITVVSKQPYQQFIEQKIWKPLGSLSA